VRLFGVASFFIGILSLAYLVVRRGQKLPTTWPDFVMMFLGVAASITGLAVFFMRFN
jgi:uncharacterized membrane protein HdeD (DUF308 family)